MEKPLYATEADRFRTGSAKLISDIIRSRRSIYADEFTGEGISDDVIWEIITNATCAPTHKMTEPWRFMVYQGSYLMDFGNYMAEYYKDYYKSKLPEPEFSAKYKYLKEYPLKASCIIGLVLIRNKKIGLPEWEEIAAVSCAVQNMALTCVAHKLGGYWSTTDAAIAYVQRSGLMEIEKPLGVFYIGHPSGHCSGMNKKRSPIEKKVTVLK